MLSLIGALLSSLGFGSANIVIKKSLDDLSIPKVLFLATLSGVFFLGLLLFNSGVEDIGPSLLIKTASLALMEVTLYLLLYKTFEVSNVSIATAIINVYPVASLIFALTFLNENIIAVKIIFVITIVLGAILTSVKWNEVFKDGFDKGDLVKGLNWMIVTMIVHALYFPLLGEFTSDGIWEFRLFLIKVFSSIFIWILFSIIRKESVIPNKEKYSPLILLGFLEILGWVGFSWAVSLESPIPQSIIIAFLSSAAVVTAVGAYIFLKERLTWLQYLGIAIIVISLTGLS